MTFVETFLVVHLEDGDACKEALIIEQLGCKVGVAPKRSILSWHELSAQMRSVAEVLLSSLAGRGQGSLQGSGWRGFAAGFLCCIPDAPSGGVLGRYKWVMCGVLGWCLGDLAGLVCLCFLLWFFLKVTSC